MAGSEQKARLERCGPNTPAKKDQDRGDGESFANNPVLLMNV